MSAFIYTAKRNIAGGHVVSDVYSIDIVLADIQESNKIHRKDHRSISGKQESYLKRIEKFIAVKTIAISESDALAGYLYEMMDSVAGGELFSFDRWGSVAVPDNLTSVTLEGSSFSVTRIKGIRHISLSFKMRAAL